MPPADLDILYCTSDDVVAFGSQEGVDLRQDDLSSALSDYGCNYATSRINDYALGRYAAIDLQTSWTVNWWATVIAVRYMAARRFNAINKSVGELYKEVMGDLRDLKVGQYMLGDVSERVVSSPRYKNMRTSVWYRLRRLRVERPISDTTPTRRMEATDLTADFIGPEY